MSIRANKIIAKLSQDDLDLLKPHLEPIDLPLRFRIEERGKKIEFAYFLIDGIASVVARGPKGAEIEVGLIGFEGMTGCSPAMGVPLAPHATYMQAAGTGLRVPMTDLLRSVEVSASLSRTVLQYMHAFFVQASHTALSNGHHTVQERLARWILMAQDRILADELDLTQEFLSLMLGVRRAGVSTAIKILTEAGFVETRRGLIKVLDRTGLEQAANGAYLKGDEFA